METKQFTLEFSSDTRFLDVKEFPDLGEGTIKKITATKRKHPYDSYCTYSLYLGFGDQVSEENQSHVYEFEVLPPNIKLVYLIVDGKEKNMHSNEAWMFDFTVEIQKV